MIVCDKCKSTEIFTELNLHWNDGEYVHFPTYSLCKSCTDMVLKAVSDTIGIAKDEKEESHD